MRGVVKLNRFSQKSCREIHTKCGKKGKTQKSYFSFVTPEEKTEKKPLFKRNKFSRLKKLVLTRLEI
jgi:hypothetical protein